MDRLRLLQKKIRTPKVSVFRVLEEPESVHKYEKYHEGPNSEDIECLPEDEKLPSQTFVPDFTDCRTETTKIKDVLSESPPLHFEKRKNKFLLVNDQDDTHWIPQGQPISEFSMKYMYSACFPSLFHDGVGDPTSSNYI